MASISTVSDSSPSTPRWTYDVFLSFRGEDTRDNFTDHLYTALVQRGIRTFRDDQLRRGEKIAPELLKAIEESRASIVVFSKTYADSRWCLVELAKIMECRLEYGQIVFPIFYHVDPSDVRKQTGSFGEAFTRYEEKWRNKAQSWREALTEAGNISGWHINKGYESEHIKKITINIVHRLHCGLLFVEDNLVGMDSHLKKISLELNTTLNDVHMVGICGIGGIGKTTIAEYVYNQISWGFECSSFLKNNREHYKNEGLLHLQNQLLNDILDGGNQKISNVRQGAYVIKNSLHSQKALIVFDDVDDMDQLEFLVGDHTWFGRGSRIIITTRDRHLLTRLQVDYVYEVEGLNSKEALKLFSQHAFPPNIPKRDYKNLLDRVIDYCQGLPLALKVLGSLLCGKTMREWESELEKLEKEPESKIQNVLKTSLDGLDHTQKKIFLDIACFFKGENRDFASKILDGCDLYGERGIRALKDRCLINISHNKINMHDLIQQMGWEIARELHPEDPSKWSRLWNVDDIYRAFISEKGMENVETISLDLSRSKEIWFTKKIFTQMKKVFSRMKNLRLLKVYYSDHGKNKMSLPKGFEFPPNLKYLHWEGLESLPSNFHGKNLVAINLKASNIKQLFQGEKCLAELKFIDLSYSQQLIKIPEFSRMPKLERLNLEGCTSFRNLDSSVGVFHDMKISCQLYLRKYLMKLNFSESGIKELPSSIGSLASLEMLNLSRCSKFKKFPDIFANMKGLRELHLNNSGIKELPSSIGSLTSLVTLQLSHCSSFEKFPEILGSNMKCLRNIYLDGTIIKELPKGIACLEALKNLFLSNCSNLEKLPEFQRTMGSLECLAIDGTAIKELSSSICHLSGLSHLFLQRSAIKELPSSIHHLTELKSLDMRKCKNLRSLPSNIYQVKSLRECYLGGCSNLKAFPEIREDMEYLKELYLPKLAIKELPSSIARLKSLALLELSDCENLETLPNGIGNLTCLHTLLIHNCPKLHKLPDDLRSLQCCLEQLDVGGCNLMEGAIPSDIWCLFSLVSLNVSENNIRCIPVGIIKLSQLNTLRMNHCPMLEEIPELPSSLRRIEAHGCPCLETLSCDPTYLLWSYLLNCFKSQIQDSVKGIFVRHRSRHIWKSNKTNVVVPARSGIPEWVIHKSMGREIRIELPKNWYEDKNFLGFALLSHHVPLNDDDDICSTIYDNCTHPCASYHVNIPQFQLRISHGDQFEHVDTISFDRNCKAYLFNDVAIRGYKDYHKGRTSFPDPALRVAYFPQIAISSKYRSSGWNNFKARFQGRFECGSKVAFKVESCGIHLIYDDAQDHHQRSLQLFNVKRSRDGIEDHTHHKKSRHV